MRVGVPNRGDRGLRCGMLWLAWCQVAGRGGCPWPPCVSAACFRDLVHRRVKPLVSSINMDPKVAAEKFGKSVYGKDDIYIMSQIHTGKMANETPPVVGCL